MALSEQELRALREIEQSLMAEDPKFGSTVSGVEFRESSFSFSLQGLAIFVLGLAILVGGIVLAQTNMWFVGLSVVGFLLMFGAGIWMMRANDAVAKPVPRNASLGGGARSGRQAPGFGGGQAGSGGFADRMDERFRNRFEDRP
ncbi:DUF3040 domain-containing protein [Staphylococcus chromogenes]|nr:DUF3040 domain-containing protein [Staphylococcus chromogenes]